MLPEGQACCLLLTWGRIFEGESQVGFYSPVSEITQRVDRKLTTGFFRAVGVAFQKETPAGTGFTKKRHSQGDPLRQLLRVESSHRSTLSYCKQF